MLYLENPSSLPFSPSSCKHGWRPDKQRGFGEIRRDFGGAQLRSERSTRADLAPPRLRSLTQHAGRCVTGTVHLTICFFGASLPNTRLSVLQPRTEWNTAAIMEKQLIMHYQLVPLATDRCLAGGTRPFHSFRTILSFSNPQPTLNLLFPSVH